MINVVNYHPYFGHFYLFSLDSHWLTIDQIFLQLYISQHIFRDIQSFMIFKYTSRMIRRDARDGKNQ